MLALDDEVSEEEPVTPTPDLLNPDTACTGGSVGFTPLVTQPTESTVFLLILTSGDGVLQTLSPWAVENPDLLTKTLALATIDWVPGIPLDATPPFEQADTADVTDIGLALTSREIT